jgi:hypothetical protein
MEYFNEVLDRTSGELLKVSKGDWITITELGQLFGTGPRRTRTILRQLGVLQVEGAENHQRHRLASWVVNKGWGKRIEPTLKPGVPFDVVGPELRAWIGERWSDAKETVSKTATKNAEQAAMALSAYQADRKRELGVVEGVSWLAHHFPQLTQEDVALILSVTRQLVSKYQRIEQARRRQLRVLKETDPDELMTRHKVQHDVSPHDDI